MRRRPVRALLGVGLLGLLPLLAASCASGGRWHIPDGYEAKFRRDRKVCRQLTDADDGEVREDRLETCLKRRGWRHERFYDGLGVDMSWF